MTQDNLSNSEPKPPAATPSAPVPDPAAPAPEPAAPAPEPAAPAPRGRGRWRRRFAWLFGILLALAVIFRIVLEFALPTVIARVGDYYGLDIKYQRAKLSLTGGHANLWYTDIRYKGRPESLIQAEYVQGDISIMQLLRGRLHVFRAVVDDVSIAVDREADGSIPVLDELMARFPQRQEPVTQIDLTSPLRIDALRLSKIRARFRDKSVAPVVETTLDLTVRVSDVAADRRKTRLEIDLVADPLVDSLRIEGEGTVGGPSLEMELRAFVRGFHPAPAAGYLAHFGIKPVAHDISGEVTGRLKLTSVNPATQPSSRPAGTPDSLYVRGSIDLDSTSLLADGEPALLCRRMRMDIEHVNLASAHISRIAIDGVEASAGRTVDGRLRVAGIEMAPTTRPAPQAASKSAPSPSAAFRLAIDELTVGDARAAFRDGGIEPAADLAATVVGLTVKGLSLDPGRPDAPVDLSGRFTLPGLAREVALSGTARPFAARRTVDLVVEAEGLKPDAVKPYLDALGLQSQLRDGRFACRLSAAFTMGDGGAIDGDLHLSGLSLKDGADLLALDDVKLSGMKLDPAKSLISIRDIAIRGPSISGRRDKSGRIVLLGCAVDPRAVMAAKEAAPVPRATPTTQTTPAPAVFAAPRIAIGRLTWQDVRARIADDMAEPPVSLSLTDFGAELTDVYLDLTGSQESKPGSFSLHLSMPGVVNNLDVRGTLTPKTEAIGFDIAFAADGLCPDLLAAYIKPTGIDPVLRSGSVSLKATGTFTQTSDGIATSLIVQNLKYADGGTELAGLDRLRVDGLSIDGTVVKVATVEVGGPRASIHRQADGAFLAGGLRIRPVTPPKQAGPIAVASPGTRPTTRPGAPILPESPIVLHVRSLKVHDAAIHWADDVAANPVRTTLRATFELDGFAYPKPAGPATIKLSAKADGAADALDVAGTFALSPTGQEAKLEIQAAGLRAGPLAPYVPPGIGITLRDGRLKTKVDAALRNHPDGGYTGHLLVDGLDYRDGADGAALLRLDSTRAIVTRADLPDTILAVEELTVAGVETDLRLLKDGSIKGLGLLLAQAPATAEPEAPAAPPPAVDEAIPDAEVRPPGAGKSGAAEAAAILASRVLRPMPQVTVGKLDLHLRRATLASETRQEASPLAVSDFRLRSLKPIDWLGADGATKPPSAFEITGRIEPAINDLKLSVQAAPFAREPSLVLDLTAGGISGMGILSLVPELKPFVEGSELTDGSLKSHLETQVKLDRAVASDFDLSRGFEMDLLIKGTEYRAVGGGPVLAGVDELRAEKVRVRPKESTFIAKSVEIAQPKGRFHRDARGIHALGWVIPLAQAEPTTKPVAAAVAAVPAPPQTSPPATQPKASRPTGEMRIDRLSISGLDLTVEDRTFQPALIVPLTNLDFEARGLSNQILYEDRPLRFNLLINSGKAPLPRRGGASRSIADGGGGTLAADLATEDRELFSQITASGKLSLYPTLNGWAKTSVNGFELTGVRGIAKAASITVGGGTVDAKVDVRLPGDGSLQARTRTVMTDLRVTEPPDGPIRRTLQLPSPLDVVIVALEDADGSITVSLPVALQGAEMAWDPVIGAAIGQFGKIVAVAIASSPLKVTQGVGSLIGLGGRKEKDTTPVSLEFASGYAGLDAEEQSRLDELIQRLRKEREMTLTLSHTLVAADVQRVRALANPSVDDASHLAERLRQRRIELATLRASVAGEARAQLAAGLDAGQSLLRLRAIDRELADAESALDAAYDLLRPGAYQEPQQLRRARSAAIDLGRQRLLVIRDTIIASGLPDIEKRLNIIKPTFNPAEDASAGSVLAVPITKKSK